jgi:hypothetical protein
VRQAVLGDTGPLYAAADPDDQYHACRRLTSGLDGLHCLLQPALTHLGKLAEALGTTFSGAISDDCVGPTPLPSSSKR